MRNLLKALLTTGGATIVSQLLALVVNKILAHTVGASGVGFYSLMRQLHDSAVGLGAVGAGGLVQGLAAREGDAKHKLLCAAILLSALGALIVAVVLLVVPNQVASGLFDRTDYATILTVMLCAVTITMGVAYSILAAVINSERAILVLALLGVGGNAVAALLVQPLASQAAIYPYILTVLIGGPLLIQAVAASVILHRRGWRLGSLLARASRPGSSEFRYFGGFFVFNIVLAIIATAAMLLVRSGIVHAGGLAAAGLFAAAWGIGMQSMSLVLSSFGTYVLPTVAAADPPERNKALQDAATLVIALSLPLLTTLLVFKPLVLRALFTAEFLPAVALLQWLLLGNYVKALSWVFAVPLLAAADLRRYFFIEAVWYCAFTGGSAIAFASTAPLAGIGIAFLASYGLYLALAVWLARARIGFLLSRRNAAVFGLGSALLAATAALTWNGTAMDWPAALAAPVVAAAVALLALTPQHRARGWALLRWRRAT